MPTNYCLTTRRPVRSAFTLTELLVVISIIAVITSALAFVVAGAQERARELRTRSQLQRIESILQRELQELLEVRIPVRTPPVGEFPAALGSHRAIAEGSLPRIQRFWTEARRVDLMYRFPYRRELVLSNRPQTVTRPTTNGPGLPTVYFRRNSGAEDYQPFHSVPTDLLAIRQMRPKTGAPLRTLEAHGMASAGSNAKTDSSELLYAVLNRIWVDGEPALSLLRQSEIGDTDRDGFPEIVDVWGNPIYFRLEVRVPVLRTSPASPVEGLFNLPLDQYSAWMTQFAMNDGQTFRPTSFTPEVFTPERIRVALYSSGVTPAFDPDNAADPRAYDFTVATN
ncbi:MAG: type II secretion system protein [Planctomycetaceae bacterium]|nr:type II secretion system protein [Planctomycetaceae bacterium]